MAAAGSVVPKLLPVLTVCRRYAVTVTFPIISGWLIYADYSRTQRWKKTKAAAEQSVHQQ